MQAYKKRYIFGDPKQLEKLTRQNLLEKWVNNVQDVCAFTHWKISKLLFAHWCWNSNWSCSIFSAFRQHNNKGLVILLNLSIASVNSTNGFYKGCWQALYTLPIPNCPWEGRSESYFQTTMVLGWLHFLGLFLDIDTMKA